MLLQKKIKWYIIVRIKKEVKMKEVEASKTDVEKKLENAKKKMSILSYDEQVDFFAKFIQVNSLRIKNNE